MNLCPVLSDILNLKNTTESVSVEQRCSARKREGTVKLQRNAALTFEFQNYNKFSLKVTFAGGCATFSASVNLESTRAV